MMARPIPRRLLALATAPASAPPGAEGRCVASAPTRRSLAALPVAAVLSPSAGHVSPHSGEHPDAELLAACARWRALNAAINDPCHPDVDRDVDTYPEWEPFRAAEAAILRARPATLAGIVAMATVVRDNIEGVGRESVDALTLALIDQLSRLGPALASPAAG